MEDFDISATGPLPVAPFPTGTGTKSDVARELMFNGISRPLVSTVLRRWALNHNDVCRVVIYHTGERYSVAVLISNATVDSIQGLNQSLIEQLNELYPPALLPETYIVGEDFSDAPMFRRFGTIVVLDKVAQLRSPAAA